MKVSFCFCRLLCFDCNCYDNEQKIEKGWSHDQLANYLCQNKKNTSKTETDRDVYRQTDGQICGWINRCHTGEYHFLCQGVYWQEFGVMIHVINIQV